MKYEAVIFDLFGTLVEDHLAPSYTNILERMAATLSVLPADFIQKWSETSRERNSGAFSSIEENIGHICKKLNVERSGADIILAARLRYDFTKKIMMNPRAGALETLSRLKQLDIKTGLISNCTPDVSIIWPETLLAPLFDVTVFSASARFMKPDQRIYSLATAGLEVRPASCLFIGNGHGRELNGAHEAGIHPVLITTDEEEGFQAIPAEESEIMLANSRGNVISTLVEILKLT